MSFVLVFSRVLFYLVLNSHKFLYLHIFTYVSHLSSDNNPAEMLEHSVTTSTKYEGAVKTISQTIRVETSKQFNQII